MIDFIEIETVDAANSELCRDDSRAEPVENSGFGDPIADGDLAGCDPDLGWRNCFVGHNTAQSSHFPAGGDTITA
jgi:hypothetical protein